MQKADDEAIIQAAELLKSGEIVAIPTETVYGLAANALDSAAIHKIFAAKNRPANNPLIVHVSGLAQIRELGLEVPEIAEKLAEKFWPGALTIILRKKYDIIPTEICCGLSTVAVRAPDHPAAIALIEACEFPLAAPSANLSGSPSPTTAAHVFADLNGRIPLILDGGECVCGVESTVVALEKGAIRILRPGRVTAEQLREFAEVEIDDAVREKLDDTRPQSPGTAYKHYCPNAQVIAVIAENEETFRNYIDMNTGCGDYALSLCDAADMGASRLFARLRELDEKGAKRIFARLPEPHGIGLAVYNRIIRAAEFNVIDLGD
ncbi:MAG: L-threonylcarbamoyladenylate synthase [Oscillospiraceae bacterium]|nr:L-threonylcarbamoyladenylate synthase [Oscillospiraceae bacterium]